MNQLLDFQKISAGKKDLNLEKINLVKFLNSCAESFMSICENKDIDFEFAVNGKVVFDEIPEEKIFIIGELDSLEKVVFNYLSNAYKFSSEGGKIILSVKQLNNENGEASVEISITDNGKGINKTDLEKLFKTFSQVDSASTREHEGSGLGLALTKELTEKMNGHVGVESEIDKGSKFSSTFPDATEMKVLLDLLIVSKDWRYRRFRKSQIASSLEEAKKLCMENLFKCIILEDDEIGLNSEWLRTLDKGQQIPKKVILTNNQSFLDKQDADFDLCAKNRWSDELNDQILTLIKDIKVSSIGIHDDAISVKEWLVIKDEQFSTEVTIADKPLKQKPDSRNSILVVEDNADLREVIFDLLRKKYRYVKTASNGVEALSIAETEKPDLIVSDWMMPQMDGPELIQRIRKNESTSSIPVILLTAKSEYENKLSGLEYGADAFLGKPFSERELISQISNLLNLKIREKEFEKELALASNLQNMVHKYLSGSYGQISCSTFYQPCAEVGGDSMQLIDQTDNGLIYFYQLDLCGHGPQASLASFYIRGVIETRFHDLKKEYEDDHHGMLRQFIDEVNDQVDRAFSGEIFSTFFFGIIVENEEKIFFINGGHPTQLIIDKNLNAKRLSAGCRPVGLDLPGFKENIKSSEAEFKKGSKLFISTDSVYELNGHKYEQTMLDVSIIEKLTTEFIKLHNELDAHKYSEFILEQTGNNKYDDDLSVFIFDFKE